MLSAPDPAVGMHRASVGPGRGRYSAADSGPAQITSVLTHAVVGRFIGVYRFSAHPIDRGLSQGVQGTDASQDLFWAVRGVLY
ncbi:hypothetical protein NDU88_008740 [Pleurodeles waltl]|uniref:Uncharacterized protein n=1 Tax=Pleurodeles waltl TaxID=8319 RepID=A0AAV7RVI8_PLEWA|nr:hypothetical protein NDU88_008740 [Pleurodeles waltl]